MESISPEASARALRAAVLAEPLWITAAGSSMGAAIADGDEVELAPASRPRFGEIWAYVDEAGRIVVHRYVGTRRGAMVFRGDAWSSTDRLVPRARLVGKVVRTAHDGSIERVRRVSGVWTVAGWKIGALKRRLARL